MVSEITINRLENVLTEVIDFSGTKEQTTIVSNMLIVNASPSGSALSGFVTITDQRDGDTILASKVPGVLYANGDLVNVLFIDGTEPVAFQQASASSGDPVAVSKLVSPDLLIDPVISADNAGDVTLAGTGDLILPDDIIHSGDTDTLISLEDDKIVLQAGSLEMVSVIEAATDEVVINDAQGDINFRVEGDAEENLLVTDAGNDRVGIGTNSPSSLFHISASSTPIEILENTGDNTADRQATIQFHHSSNEGARIETQRNSGDSDGMTMRFYTEIIGGALSLAMTITDSQRVGIGTGNVLGKLSVRQTSTSAAIPAATFEQRDVSEEILGFTGTAAAATLTQSIVAEADVTTATRQGFVKVFVTDNGNQITDQAYFMPLFTLA